MPTDSSAHFFAVARTSNTSAHCDTNHRSTHCVTYKRTHYGDAATDAFPFPFPHERPLDGPNRLEAEDRGVRLRGKETLQARLRAHMLPKGEQPGSAVPLLSAVMSLPLHL
jgi:hypothetical protein